MEVTFWKTDTESLRDVITDRARYNAAFDNASDEDLIWLLSIDGRLEEAEAFGRDVMATTGPRFRTLLLLARVLQWQGAIGEATSLQARALLQARTPEERANALHSIGERLFAEQRFSEAEASFQEALAICQAIGADLALAPATIVAIRSCRQRLAITAES